MKKHLLFSALVLGIIILSRFVYAQTFFCGTIVSSSHCSTSTGDCKPCSCGDPLTADDNDYISQRDNVYAPFVSGSKKIHIVLHIVRTDEGIFTDCFQKRITNQDIADIMQKLNDDFAGVTVGDPAYDTKISFCYTVNYIDNTYFYEHYDDLYSDIVNSHSSPSDTWVNVFIGGERGYSNSSVGTRGSVRILAADFFPGTSVLTHEVGHYLGLFHTFDGVQPFPCLAPCISCDNLVRELVLDAGTIPGPNDLREPFEKPALYVKLKIVNGKCKN